MLLKPCNTYIWLLIKGGLILTKSDFYEKTNKYIIMSVEPIIILYNNVYIWYYTFLSAGVGRSGTYITIDAMLQRLKDEDTLNIYEFVTKCRTRRTFMVQNQVITIVIYVCTSCTERFNGFLVSIQDQYVFIHDALNDYLTCGETAVPVYELRRKITDLEAPVQDKEVTGFQFEFDVRKY